MDDIAPTRTVAEAGRLLRVVPNLVYAWCGDGSQAHRCLARAGKRGTILIATADLDAIEAAFHLSGGTKPSPTRPLRLDYPPAVCRATSRMTGSVLPVRATAG